jgi:hypothetical protein
MKERGAVGGGARTADGAARDPTVSCARQGASTGTARQGVHGEQKKRGTIGGGVNRGGGVAAVCNNKLHGVPESAKAAGASQSRGRDGPTLGLRREVRRGGNDAHRGKTAEPDEPNILPGYVHLFLFLSVFLMSLFL